MKQIDPNLDWVTVRAKCNPKDVFDSLKAQVESDVDKRDALRSEDELAYQIKFVFEGAATAFKVTRAQMMEPQQYVVFSLTDQGIKVSYKSDMVLPTIPATLTLSDEGECKLMADGKEYYSWQFRKRALEPVLFAGAPDR
jgi:hypothetical protein